MSILMKACGVLSAALLVGLAGCAEKVNPRVETRLNDDATLASDLTPNPMTGKVITSWADPTNKTMSTMFGNEAAVQYARTSAETKYPAGAVLSVVTWNQQEDARWFGGRIPAKPNAVEVVTVGAGTATYQRYEGSPLKRVVSEEGAAPSSRAGYLLAQRAAVMP